MFMHKQRIKLMILRTGSMRNYVKRVLDKFPKCHMKILLGDFNAKVSREDISKPTAGDESLHTITKDSQ
jgi:ribosomal protein RSM22 (predicted rRNA methylase)